MKKYLIIIGLLTLIIAPEISRSQGCYITKTGDYICDGKSGVGKNTVQRAKSKNVPGGNNVFKSNDVRSQFGWMPKVLINLGINLKGSGSGDMTVKSNQTSGVGTAQWSGAECEEGVDAYQQFKADLLRDEGRENCSYYDGVGNPDNCDYGRTGSQCSGCGGCGGCLTIGVGHLVRSGEPYAPCNTCISDAEVDALFEQDASRFWSHVTSHLQEACLEDEGCFAIAVGSVLYQGGTNFLRGTFSRRWNQIVNSQYQEAAAGWENTRWGTQSLNRVQNFQAALMALQEREDAGEPLGCGNSGGGGSGP